MHPPFSGICRTSGGIFSGISGQRLLFGPSEGKMKNSAEGIGYISLGLGVGRGGNVVGKRPSPSPGFEAFVPLVASAPKVNFHSLGPLLFQNFHQFLLPFLESVCRNSRRLDLFGGRRGKLQKKPGKNSEHFPESPPFCARQFLRLRELGKTSVPRTLG